MRRVASINKTIVNFPTPNRGEPKATEPEDQTTTPRLNASDGSINILIVDDEPKNLTVLETVLSNPASLQTSHHAGLGV